MWVYKESSLLSQEKALGVLAFAVSLGLRVIVWTRPQLSECLFFSHSCVREKKDKIVC